MYAVMIRGHCLLTTADLAEALAFARSDLYPLACCVVELRDCNTAYLVERIAESVI